MTATQVDLTTMLGELVLPSPVITAAGCGGSGPELAPYTELDRLGAFTTRTLTVDARPGSAAPRLVETPGGVLTALGGHNPGLQAFLATELPWLAQRRVRTIVSVAGSSLAEYGEIARRLGTSAGVVAVEVSLGADSPFAHDPFQAGKVLHVVRRDVPAGVSVLAKLTPTAAYLDVARAVADNGADALVIGHGQPGLVFDPASLRPALGALVGELSGPAVLPQALHGVWEVHGARPDVPLVGAGGVRTGWDALQMLLAGASAVQVGTALLSDPGAAGRIAEELAAELAQRGVAGAVDLVGQGHRIRQQEDA
jgi:dihydroorotate dehydrogenase (NAD+) catalytic subunit